MTKNWYASLLYCFNQLGAKKNVFITFGYTHAMYSPSKGDYSYNRIIEPLQGFCNLSIPSKPTALITCLGNEPNRIDGLQEYFDATLFLFYTDSIFDNEFAAEVEGLHEELIAATKLENVFKFPITDLIFTYYLLQNLCTVLLNEFRIIIAPCSPKPFALLSMLNALHMDDFIEVWRISPGASVAKIDRIPNGYVSVLEVSFV